MITLANGRGRRAALLAALLALAAAMSCGRKTRVEPPELVAPRTVEGVSVTNKPTGIEIEWDRPTRYVDGSNMLDLAGFRVDRRRACCGYQTIERVPIEDRFRFQRTKRFQYLDEEVSSGEVYLYQIVAFTLDGYESAPSEAVQIERQSPAAEPTAAPAPTP